MTATDDLTTWIGRWDEHRFPVNPITGKPLNWRTLQRWQRDGRVVSATSVDGRLLLNPASLRSASGGRWETSAPRMLRGAPRRAALRDDVLRDVVADLERKLSALRRREAWYRTRIANLEVQLREGTAR